MARVLFPQIERFTKDGTRCFLHPMGGHLELIYPESISNPFKRGNLAEESAIDFMWDTGYSISIGVVDDISKVYSKYSDWEEVLL